MSIAGLSLMWLDFTNCSLILLKFLFRFLNLHIMFPPGLGICDSVIGSLRFCNLLKICDYSSNLYLSLAYFEIYDGGFRSG